MDVALFLGKEDFGGEQFVGNLCGVAFDALAEVPLFQFSPFDFRQVRFPLSGHLRIAYFHLSDDGIDGKSFLRGDERLLLAYHVFTGKEGFDDGGTGCRCADTAIFELRTQFLILQLFACRLHSCQQRTFRVQGLGLGRSLCQRTGTERELSAFLPFGDDDAFSVFTAFPFFGFQLFLVFLLAVFEDSTPTLFLDDFTFENELHAFAGGSNRTDILHASGGEGFEHTSDYHVVDDRFLPEHVYRLLARDEQGVVVGHFLAVHRMRIKFGQSAGMDTPDGMVV